MPRRLLLLIVGLFALAGCDRSEKPDFHYKVLSKVYTEGELSFRGEYDAFGAQVKTRVDPKFEIIVKGVESGREYPPLAVKETAFKGFVEGAVYDRSALNAARK